MLKRGVYDSFVQDFKLGHYSYKDGKLYRHIVGKNQYKIELLSTPLPAALSSSRGYMRVNYKGRYIYEHRLIFAAIHGVDELIKHQCIDHINGNKQDNHIENLRGLSIKENTLEAEKLGNFKRTYGSLNGSCKLTEDQVEEIRKLYDVGLTQREIADKFKISQGHVSGIVQKKKRKYA